MKKNLEQAKANKNDEFYTQLTDIERELRHYKDHFKGKTVYCNCDDPKVSNFFHYFSYNFEHLGLKKLITTCYKNQDMDLFSKNNKESAIALVYEGEKDNGRVPTIENIGIIELEGDGDFRSKEAIGFLKEADIVVTNPPFSLFREYVSQLIEYNKDFVILGNQNAITYKEIFPLLKENRMWLGHNIGGHEFIIPNNAPDRSGQRIDENGIKYQKFGNIAWYTNLDIAKRHDDIFSYKEYNSEEYPTYDNYNAIEVSRVTDIPKDYKGAMGVPISFLDKYNPNQFEILGINTSYSDELNHELVKPTKKYKNVKQYSKNGSITSGNKINDSSVISLKEKPINKTYYRVPNSNNYYIINYARIFIIRKGE